MQVSVELNDARGDLAEEEVKLQKQHEENVRRKHNYLPFVLKLVESLAGIGKLNDLVDSARTTAAARAAEKAKTEKK